MSFLKLSPPSSSLSSSFAQSTANSKGFFSSRLFLSPFLWFLVQLLVSFEVEGDFLEAALNRSFLFSRLYKPAFELEDIIDWARCNVSRSLGTTIVLPTMLDVLGSVENLLSWHRLQSFDRSTTAYWKPTGAIQRLLVLFPFPSWRLHTRQTHGNH